MAELKDHHSTIYTSKIKRIVNALNVGNFSTEKDFINQLIIACETNKCSTLETQTIQSVGQQIALCHIRHLKAHNIENSDATNLCNSQQVMLGCDTLATPLMRKMCYTGNKYSLKIWQEKELKIKSRKRMPASKN